jgi:hypothetical protein
VLRFAAKLARPFLMPLLMALAVFSQDASNPEKPRAPDPNAVIVSSVRIIQEAGTPALEIVCSRPVTPTIRATDSPPKIVIDLPNTRSGMPRSRIDVLQKNILTIRTEQRQNPAAMRIEVSFLVPYGFAWEAEGNRLMVHLKPPKQLYEANAPSPAQPPQVVSITPAPPPAIVPVTSGVGEVLLAGRRFALGSSLTAGSETAVLQLSRGGEVRVCPGTTLSVTPSKNAKDLMMGLSTGAMETHYAIGESADTILTPDFRILFPGPGEFDYAISTDSKGNTCVRGLKGNTSAAIVSELIGDRVYQVKPAEQAVFREGRIDRIDPDVPAECGCPPPPPAVLRAGTNPPNLASDSDSPKVSLAQGDTPTTSSANAPNEPHDALSAGPETKALPASQTNDFHVQVEAPLIFRGRKDPANASAPIQEAQQLPVMESSARSASLQVQALPPPSPGAEGPPQHRGFLGRIKGFFAAIFR